LDPSLINETTICPIYTIFRENNKLHTIDWDQLGLSLVNKLHNSIIKTQKYRLESGLVLSELPTRLIIISSGVIWIGANRYLVSSFNSNTDILNFTYHVNGIWTSSSISNYNNTQYDDGTNLVTLNPNKYAVNYIYRSIDEHSECNVILGGGNYTLTEAQNSIPPTGLPNIISSHGVLVGKIIVLQGADIAYQINSVFDTKFSISSSANHNDLNSLQGGSASEYYHLSLPTYNNVMQSNGFTYKSYTMTSGSTYSFTNFGSINTLSVNKTIGSTTSVVLNNPGTTNEFYVVKDRKGDSLTNPIIVSAGTYSIDGLLKATMSQVGNPSLTFLFDGDGYIII
jgi:hypothetical protein